MSFNKDALLHKLQDENEKYKLANRAGISEISLLMKENKKLKDVAWEINRNDIKEILYSFIDFHTTREIDTLDLKILADRFLDEQLGKEENNE